MSTSTDMVLSATEVTDERGMGSFQFCLELLRYTGACLTLQADLNGRDDDEPDYKKRMRSTQPHPVCSNARGQHNFRGKKNFKVN
jgi:hypothetical protein